MTEFSPFYQLCLTAVAYHLNSYQSLLEDALQGDAKILIQRALDTAGKRDDVLIRQSIAMHEK